VTFSKKTGGAFAAITAPKRRSGAAWVAIQNGYRRASGAWVQIYTALSASILDNSVSFSAPSGTPTVGYQLNTDGKVWEKAGASASLFADTGEVWMTSGALANFECRATLQSGTTPNSGTLNTWLPLTTARSWTQISGGAIVVTVLLIEIRNASTLAVLDSAVITMDVERA
jgi:hypothetical protein